MNPLEQTRASADLAAFGVLVVEDDADTRANLADILELDGYYVELAPSVADALARADWSKMHAIVLDRRLPDGTAEELLPRLRQLAPDAAVIVVTGYGDLQGAIAALRMGAVDYILKPINPAELRNRLGNVVERRRAAQQLREAQQRALQAERLAAIGETMAGLTHESRNALQRSKACLEMLAVEVEGQPEALDLVARIQRAQEQLYRLYEEVREYAAPINLKRESCELSKVWREAWANLTHAWQEKHISLEEQISADSGCMIDQFAISQVFRNIFENAIAASPARGTIVVTCGKANIEGSPALRAAVRDQGPGLAGELRRRIFEPFFTTKTKGTGLGMPIAQRIVQSHGGLIAVADDCQTGAEIVISLPRGLV